MAPPAFACARQGGGVAACTEFDVAEAWAQPCPGNSKLAGARRRLQRRYIGVRAASSCGCQHDESRERGWSPGS